MLRRWIGGRRPTWADGLSTETYNSFRAAAEARLGDIGRIANWDEWDAGLVFRHADGQVERVALARVAALYADTPSAQRQALLDEFFGTVGRTSAAVPETWEDARDELLAKIYPITAFMDNPADGMVVRQVSDDLIALLQVERPASFVGVSRDAADEWHVPDAEIWAQALENVHARVPVVDETREVAPGSSVRVLHNQHRLVASHLLELERHFETAAPDRRAPLRCGSHRARHGFPGSRARGDLRMRIGRGGSRIRYDRTALRTIDSGRDSSSSSRVRLAVSGRDAARAAGAQDAATGRLTGSAGAGRPRSASHARQAAPIR